MRKSAAVIALCGVALFLGGCDEKKDLIRLGILNAPFCYLAALAVLVAIRALWRWRAEDVNLRPGVLAIPFVGLLAAAVVSLTSLRQASKEMSDVIFAAIFLSPVIFPILAGALCVPLLFIWRLWFALSPKDSFEGAALVATALFFAPGLCGLFGLVPVTSDFVAMLSLLSFFMANGAIPLALILILEAYLSKGRAQKK
jgi:hypothetical protein